MKINELKQIIREEIEKVLAEAPIREEETPTRKKEAPVKPTTTPSQPTTTPSRTKRPGPGIKEKPKAEKTAEKIAEKIGNRYSKMLKNKK